MSSTLRGRPETPIGLGPIARPVSATSEAALGLSVPDADARRSAVHPSHTLPKRFRPSLDGVVTIDNVSALLATLGER
jgi:hypothetical protein